MPQRGVPLLALVLAAAAASRLRLSDEAQERLQIAFTDSVAAMDNADRGYREAIERTLPRDVAHKMLSAMAAFRECAHQVREAAMHEMREIYRRYNRAWDWIDPLDATPVLPQGLSHADATRIATIGDRARAQVDGLRTQANDSVSQDLSADQRHTIRDAKIERRDRFEQTVRATLTQGAGEVEQSDLDKAVDHLTALADGWY